MVKFGVEIETIYDYSKVKNFKVNGFSCHDDGSLRVYDERQRFIQPNEIEIVSKVFTDKTEFLKAIDNFINYCSKKGKYELKDVLSFNKSCGCHIHISFNGKGNNYFRKISHFKLLKKVRAYHFDLIKQSKVKSQDEILKHYFRNYARKTTAKNLLDYNRYKEFNFISDTENTGLEMRGCNILNVESWSEFKEMMTILFDTALFLEKSFEQYNIKSTINLNQFLKDLNELELNKDKIEKIELGI